MRKSEVYGGDWIRANAGGGIECKGIDPAATQALFTIKGRLTTHTFDDEKQQRVCEFGEVEQKLGLNATNWDSIARIAGSEDDDDWAGTKVELFVIPEPKSKTGHAIRVRKPSAVAAPTTPVKVLGESGRDRLLAALEAKQLDVPNFKHYMAMCGFDTTKPMEAWPFDWSAKIKAYLDNPAEAVKAEEPPF